MPKHGEKYCSRDCRREHKALLRSAPLTHDELITLLSYDPATGIFTWNDDSNFHGKNGIAGSVAGSLHHKGYIRIEIRRQGYAAHRLAWFYVHRVWPSDQIDHRDTNRAHNAIDNLREATNGLNRANSRPSPKSELKLKGVTRQGKRFLAQIGVNKKHRSLGSYETVEEAHAVYAAAAREAFGEFARTE